MIQLNLTKGNTTPIQLALTKVGAYRVKLYWDSTHDLDIHTIALSKTGLDNDADRVLSCFNQAMLQEGKTENTFVGYKGPFTNNAGYLKHYGDARTGIQAKGDLEDEMMEINVAKTPSNISEFIFVASFYPFTSGTFKDVKDAHVVIEDETGKEYLRANLTTDFDDYDIAIIGGLKLENNSWMFNPTSMGIQGDFNTVLQQVN